MKLTKIIDERIGLNLNPIHKAKASRQKKKG
jgi:hypothetical protein